MSLLRREFLILFAAAMAGAILVVPYQLALLPSAPRAPLALLVVADLVQAAILIAIAAAAGLWFARRSGLGAPILEASLRGERSGEALRRTVPLAVVVGLGSSAALILLEALIFAPQLPALSARIAPPPPWTGLLASFYGGITEEVLTRLFLLSLFAWLFTRLSRGPAAYWAAILASAVIFGLGHLPAAAAIAPLSPLVVARALLLNGIPGMMFGWLYWRRGLEAAMVAHFVADLIVHVGTPLVVV